MACAAAALATLAAAGLLSVRDAGAHKPVTTRFTFGRDVAPILQARCAPCHRAGGPGPMPLDTHAAARPWAQAIAERVLEGTMPPWFAEPDGEAIRPDRGLTAKEIDILAAWALGGAPLGETGPSSPAAEDASSSPPAPPGQGIAVEAVALGEVSLAAGEVRAELETSGPPLDRERWLAGWWVEPGRPDLVRAGALELRGDGERSIPAGGWVQGFGEALYPDGAGLRIPAGSRPSLRLHAGRGLGSERGSARFGIVLHLAFHRERPALELSPVRLDRDHPLESPTAIAACAPAGAGTLEVIESSARRRALLTIRDGAAGWPLLHTFETPVRLGSGAILHWSPRPGAETPAATVFVITEPVPGLPPRGAPPRRR